MAVPFALALGEGGCARESSVLLKGSWDSWGREVPLHFSAAAGAFEASVSLAPAVYQVCTPRGSEGLMGGGRRAS